MHVMVSHASSQPSVRRFPAQIGARQRLLLNWRCKPSAAQLCSLCAISETVSLAVTRVQHIWTLSVRALDVYPAAGFPMHLERRSSQAGEQLDVLSVQRRQHWHHAEAPLQQPLNFRPY